jgi:hypothetical protein
VSGGTYNYLFNDADAGLYNLNSQRTAVFRRRDQDGNGNYTPGELNLSLNGPDFISISSAANRRFNSDLVQPMTSELTASFERELVANLGVRVGYVFRHRKDYYSNRTLCRLRRLYRPEAGKARGIDRPAPKGQSAAGEPPRRRPASNRVERRLFRVLPLSACGRGQRDQRWRHFPDGCGLAPFETSLPGFPLLDGPNPLGAIRSSNCSIFRFFTTSAFILSPPSLLTCVLKPNLEIPA